MWSLHCGVSEGPGVPAGLTHSHIQQTKPDWLRPLQLRAELLPKQILCIQIPKTRKQSSRTEGLRRSLSANHLPWHLLFRDQRQEQRGGSGQAGRIRPINCAPPQRQPGENRNLGKSVKSFLRLREWEY